MKKLLIFAFVLIAGAVSAQSYYYGDADYAMGYEITKNIRVAKSKSPKAKSDMSIQGGRVCIKRCDSQEYHFPQIDCSESLTVGREFVAYQEPAQDEVPNRYVKTAVFNQSARKVKVFMNAPESWTPDRKGTFVPRTKNEDCCSTIEVKPVVVKDRNAVYVNYDEDNRKSVVPMYGKTVYELTLNASYLNEGGTRVYIYNGCEVTKNGWNETGDDFAAEYAQDIKIDENGFLFWLGDSSPSYRPFTEMGPVIGEYPVVEFFGWLDEKTIVLDDVIYEMR